ncbi:MAG: hypothetical protein ACJ79S_04170 [Gemmatimonadaceae bacterium]
MIRRARTTTVAMVLAATACASGGSTTFVSSWKAPEATPLQLKGARVAAVAMMRSESARRAAEDALARELTNRGARGVPMYTVAPHPAGSEAAARAALERADIAGVVVMRPLGRERETTVTPGAYAGPVYRGYWGGYYGFGWGAAWGPPVSGVDVRTDTVVSVETLVYSLRQNRLVWAGQSRTTNPANVDRLVTEVATAAGDEMRKQGLLAK